MTLNYSQGWMDEGSLILKNLENGGKQAGFGLRLFYVVPMD